MQDFNSSTFSVYEPVTSEGREQSDSLYAPYSPNPNMSPTSPKLKDARPCRREAVPNADTTVSPVSADLEASPAVTTAPGEKALRKTRRRTVDNDGVYANH